MSSAKLLVVKFIKALNDELDTSRFRVLYMGKFLDILCDFFLVKSFTLFYVLIKRLRYICTGTISQYGTGKFPGYGTGTFKLLVQVLVVQTFFPENAFNLLYFRECNGLKNVYFFITKDII